MKGLSNSDSLLGRGWASVPTDSEDARAFLQRRLSILGRTLFGLSTVFGVLSALLGHIYPESFFGAPFGVRAQIVQVAIALTGLLLWRGTTTRPWSQRTLHAIDAVATVTIGVVIAVASWWTPGRGRADLFLMLAGTHVLVARAAMVPSSPRRTVLVSILTCLPEIVLPYVLHGLGAGIAVSASTTATAILCALLAALATAAISRVIYGLELRVRAAMQLGQYTLEEKLGEGGMGEVYRARHALLRRPTAVKLLPPETAGEHNVARFEREVQLTSLLTHPNTIAIYDFGRTPDSIFYYAMEYLEGITLEDLVREHGPQPAGRVVHILLQMCGSLAEAHGVGLIHRDVKPANVMLCERGGVPDVVKVLDFGLVKDVGDDDASQSLVRAIAGTPMYMPPEAIRDPADVGPRSDLYALGAVAYFLLTGRPVFEGKSIVEVCAHHLHTPPVPPSRRVPGIPKDLEALVLRCLEKDPSRRPASAEALRRELQALRDAGAWDEEDAGAWWRTYHDEKGRSAARPAAREASPFLTSLPVDLSARAIRAVG